MSLLGQLIQDARKEQGMTIDDLQARTKIRSRYLEALEKGEYDVIPGEVYLRGFVRLIAAELGINQEEAMAAYEADKAGGGSKPKQEAAATREATADRLKDPAEVAPVLKERASRRQTAEQKRSVPWPLVLGLVLLAGLSIFAYFYWQGAAEEGDLPGGEVGQVDPGPVAPVEPEPEPAPAGPTIVLQNPGELNPVFLVSPGPLDVQLRAENGQVWVRTTVGTVVRELTLNSQNPNQRSLDLQSEQEITILVGNPPALRLIINGEDQGILGGNNVRTVRIRVNQGQ